MNYFGDKTPKATILTTEAHKLHLAFVVADGVDIHPGQPVKLTNDGKITPLLAADPAYLCIGNSIHWPEGETFTGEITVVMRGHMTIRAKAAAVQNAGPVKFTAYDATNLVNTYGAAADAATTQGYSLDQATAIGQEINVVLI